MLENQGGVEIEMHRKERLYSLLFFALTFYAAINRLADWYCRRDKSAGGYWQGARILERRILARGANFGILCVLFEQSP